MILFLFNSEVQSYKIVLYDNNNFRYKISNNNNKQQLLQQQQHRRRLYGTTYSPSSIEVPPLVDLILLESSQVDSSKLIEAKSIIDSDNKGKERSKYVWNAKNDALISTFQYKIQMKDDSIETMTLNERINELNTENNDKSKEDNTIETIPAVKTFDEDGNEITPKKRGRPRKTKELL